MINGETTELKKFAARIRLETVRQIAKRGFGHIGGALSIVDALAVLYGGVMRIDPKNPAWAERDKLVMSKGHAGPALYSALALKGYFPLETLNTLNQPGTSLPSHCDRRLTPGIDVTTGSLGQGVSLAIGLAMAQRMDGKGARTFLITGDGELNEGQSWEGAMFAAHSKLDNLVWFVDYNHKQLDGYTSKIMDLGDVGARFAAFGWRARTINGNDTAEIMGAVEGALAAKGAPACIVLDTVKGAGVPAVENTMFNHHMVFEGEIARESVLHLENALAALEGE